MGLKLFYMKNNIYFTSLLILGLSIASITAFATDSSSLSASSFNAAQQDGYVLATGTIPFGWRDKPSTGWWWTLGMNTNGNQCPSGDTVTAQVIPQVVRRYGGGQLDDFFIEVGGTPVWVGWGYTVSIHMQTNTSGGDTGSNAGIAWTLYCMPASYTSGIW